MLTILYFIDVIQLFLLDGKYLYGEDATTMSALLAVTLDEFTEQYRAVKDEYAKEHADELRKALGEMFNAASAFAIGTQNTNVIHDVPHYVYHETMKIGGQHYRVFLDTRRFGVTSLKSGMQVLRGHLVIQGPEELGNLRAKLVCYHDSTIKLGRKLTRL